MRGVFNRKIYKPDPKIPFPQSLEEAKTLIAKCFAWQGIETETGFETFGWNNSEQKFYLNSLGIDNTVENLTRSEARRVITDLMLSQMILFSVSKN